MKKKIIAMLLACTMIVPAGALRVMAAEETEAVSEESSEPIEISWEEDIAPEVEEAAWEGDFITIGESGLKMWMVSVLAETELTEEDVEEGYLAYLTDEDGNYAVLIQDFSDVDVSLEEFEESIAEDATDVDRAVINDLNAVSFTLSEDDMSGMAVETEDGTLVVFYFMPASDEEFSAVAGIMFMSIQADDEAAEEATEEETAAE